LAKKIRAIIKLQIEAGKANPAPPVGPALGQHGVNIMAFCKDYNERTGSQAGTIVPVEITVYEDRSFIYVLKTPPVSDLLKRAIAIEKGSAAQKREKVGQISPTKVREIAAIKLRDLNTTDIQSAVKTVEATARSMGIEVREPDASENGAQDD
jgi:large subunit ribosomal protein L11